MDKRLKVAIEPFKTLYIRGDELENHLNTKLSEMLAQNLVYFKVALGKVKADIMELQRQYFVLPSDLTAKEFDDQGSLFDITRKPVKK